MMFFSSLVLSAAMWVSGIEYIENPLLCKQPQNAFLLGAYDPKIDTLYICEDNINHSDQTKETITKHELVHAIQDKIGAFEDESIRLIPEPWLTRIVRQTMEDGETLAILLNYKGNTDHEFEARILQNLPADIIAFLLITTHIFA